MIRDDLVCRCPECGNWLYRHKPCAICFSQSEKFTIRKDPPHVIEARRAVLAQSSGRR
jgi:hypothetical protein